MGIRLKRTRKTLRVAKEKGRKEKAGTAWDNLEKMVSLCCATDKNLYFILRAIEI